jgi:hypothetical protein
MKDQPKASLGRMGKLNNGIVDLLDNTSCSPAEVLQVLQLHVYRLNRAFEILVTPRRLPAPAKKEK